MKKVAEAKGAEQARGALSVLKRGNPLEYMKGRLAVGTMQ